MQPQPDAKVNGYIDDAHTSVINNEEAFKRTKVAYPLALGLLFRKSEKYEPINREEILQKVKIKGEGTLSKLKIPLGCLIDSRLLLCH
eukprot:15328919-Ditylum_brightwellii.AAC.1